DPDMHLFVEGSIRGGLCQQVVRHVKANNPECPNYNPELPESHILYVDSNGLYAKALSEPLPKSNFEWVDVDIETILKHPIDSPYGYMVEVSVECPPEIHGMIADFPPLSHHDYVNPEELSEYQQNLVERFDLKIGKSKKLLM